MQDKRILITGASAGIGRALAVKLASGGNRVVALARDPEKLASLAAEIPSIETVALDLADTAAVRDFAEAGWRGPLDVLVNNAGVQVERRLDDPGCKSDAMTGEIAVNLTAPIVLTRGLLPHLLEGGMVVNLVSALALAPKDTAACYSATKAGLRMFSRGLRAQFPRERLRVLNIYPPLVDTAMTTGRGTGKMAPGAAADAIIAAMQGHRDEVLIGKTRIIAMLSIIAPKLATRLMSG
ncbi:MAG: SDR family NAD(P)-dependent oxidoreductase [Pseudomonadota bacterium]|nr:SDR family NAD(P)-dependent oxidoreductase [Pseudomonadota bacterium]